MKDLFMMNKDKETNFNQVKDIDNNSLRSSNAQGSSLSLMNFNHRNDDKPLNRK